MDSLLDLDVQADQCKRSKRVPRPCPGVFCRDRAGILILNAQLRRDRKPLSLSRSPARLNLHHALGSGGVVTKAAHAHSSGPDTSPLFTGLRWMYLSFLMRLASAQVLKS